MNFDHHPCRLDATEQVPQVILKLAGLDQSLTAPGGIDKPLALLVDIRVSQLNGCAFCLDMHAKQARMAGERELRLHHLAGWRDSPLYAPRERAALAWAEALTRLGPDGIPDDLYAAVGEHFDPQALALLTVKVMLINGWNRLNIAFRTEPGSKDKAYGLEGSGLD